MEDAQSRASKYRNVYMLGRHRDVLDLSYLSPVDYDSACGELNLAPVDIAFDCLPRLPEVDGCTLVSGVALAITPPSPEALLVPWKQHRKGRITVAYGPSALLLHRASNPTSGRVVIVGPLSKQARFSYVELAPDPEEWSPALLRAFFEDAQSVLIEQRHKHADDGLFRITMPNNGVRILAPWQSTAKWVWTARALAPDASIEVRSWGNRKTIREFLP
ncbi:MAG TPA: hypothetical protein VIU82_10420 [Bosea sp. (in: a-proteobacteria)]